MKVHSKTQEKTLRSNIFFCAAASINKGPNSGRNVKDLKLPEDLPLHYFLPDDMYVNTFDRHREACNTVPSRSCPVSGQKKKSSVESPN